MRRPPLLTRWALRRLLSAADRRALESDLAELWELRRRRDGELEAAAWLRRQWRQLPWRLLGERLRGGDRRLGDHETSTPAQAAIGARRAARPGRESLGGFLRELRCALHGLARTPVLAATIVLTVGVGLGATTLAFAVLHAVVLEPLPYRDADALVRIFTDSPPNRWPLSVVDYRAIEEQQTRFLEVAGYRTATFTFHRGDVAERVEGMSVTGAYFHLLGLSPLRGRLLDASDDDPSAAQVVVVSESFAARHLGGADRAVGRSIRLDGVDLEVVGVLPPRTGPLEHGREVFVPARWPPPERRGPFFITALGRLPEPSEAALAERELRLINRRIFPLWESSYQDRRASWGTIDLRQHVIGDVEAPLLVVFVALGFVLLVASTNAANLLGARMTERRRELAVRRALGASRGRILQHLLAEGVLLAIASALLAALLARSSVGLLVAVGADVLPRAAEIALDATVVLFLLASALASGVLFAGLPSLAALSRRLDAGIAPGDRSAAPRAGPPRLRHALVVVQFAVTAPLLVASGLLLSSLDRLRQVDVGFESDGVLTATLALPPGGYPDAASVGTFWQRLLDEVAALPGVEAAAVADGRPPREIWMTNNFDLVDRPTPEGESQPTTPWVAVSHGYFPTLHIPLVDGRLFDARDDRDGAPLVAVVDEAWARRFFADESVLGRRFLSGGCTDCEPFTVVGVVGDVKHAGLDGPPEGTVYWPMSLSPARSRFLLLRSAGEPAALLPQLRRLVRELDPSIPLARVATGDELVADALARPRTLALVSSSFAGVALALSIVGVYGIVSFFVQQRRRDIGIRLALGGGPARVARLVVGQGMTLVFVGLLVGIGGALLLTRALSSLLFEVTATDLTTFAAVALVQLGVALLACLVPARRATRLDPAATLRVD